MSNGRILIAYDGSENARHAIEVAAAEIGVGPATVLHAWEPLSSASSRLAVYAMMAGAGAPELAYERPNHSAGRRSSRDERSAQLDEEDLPHATRGPRAAALLRMAAASRQRRRSISSRFASSSSSPAPRRRSNSRRWTRPASSRISLSISYSSSSSSFCRLSSSGFAMRRAWRSRSRWVVRPACFPGCGYPNGYEPRKRSTASTRRWSSGAAGRRSFVKMFVTCFSTARGEMKSRRPIA
jgi:nucleotide-binding universal stress UspA family protein